MTARVWIELAQATVWLGLPLYIGGVQIDNVGPFVFGCAFTITLVRAVQLYLQEERRRG